MPSFTGSNLSYKGSVALTTSENVVKRASTKGKKNKDKKSEVVPQVNFKQGNYSHITTL